MCEWYSTRDIRCLNRATHDRLCSIHYMVFLTSPRDYGLSLERKRQAERKENAYEIAQETLKHMKKHNTQEPVPLTLWTYIIAQLENIT